VFPLWSQSTERALLDLQRAKQHELDEDEAGRSLLAELAADPDVNLEEIRPGVYWGGERE